MHKIIVQKYGGTSVADTNKIKNVAKKIISYKKKGYSLVVVVSALGNTTDELIELAHDITKSPSERELDMLVSTGEQVSVALLAMAIHKLGYEAISFTGAQVGIITDKSHTQARILNINTKRIEQELKKGKVVIVAGFQGVTSHQDITTLGRGGSNLTAVALAKALKAQVCEMFTDVDGVYTADPRIVPNAKKILNMSYEEMFELASLGAQILQARSVEMAQKFNVPIHVRSSFSNKQGTIISKEERAMEDIVVSGVTVNKDEAKITICDVSDRPGIAAKIFKYIADKGINIDMIIQNISRTKATDISFTVLGKDLAKTMTVVKAISKKIGSKDVTYNKDIAKVSVVGIGMKSHSGIAARMFKALAKKKINIEMISTSEIKISCVIDKKSADSAVRAIHDEFRLGK
ncbi:MAG: aspartate kinase [Candidatus Omnitrophica bacterium]|nr:aspartate kinase [Candidatus Omnitrophota bacterium]